MNRIRILKILLLLLFTTIWYSCATHKLKGNISEVKAQMLRDSAHKYAWAELDIKKATIYYDSLFTSNYIKKKDYYNAGQVAAEVGNYAKCIYLWTKLQQVKNDDEYGYVNTLPEQVGAQEYYEKLINAKGFAKFWQRYYPNYPLDPRLSYQDSLLVKKINQMFLTDQAVRHNYQENPTKKNDSLYRSCDAVNTKIMDSIIVNRGIISPKQLGYKAGKEFVILFAHLPDSLIKRYMPQMETTLKHKGINTVWYALIKDKWLVYNKKEQLYGTQFHIDTATTKITFFPIWHIEQVDKRRKKMGLGKLQYYAEHYKVLLPENYSH